MHQIADELRRLAPDAEEVEVIYRDTVKMFDCGANLDTIECPSCKAHLDIGWWQDRVDEGYDEDDESFDLRALELPCCRHRCTLNDLLYDFDQGFSRWGINVMNPNIGILTDATVARLEEIVGCQLKVVYQHI